jgi:hypothetical protein
MMLPRCNLAGKSYAFLERAGKYASLVNLFAISGHEGMWVFSQ